MIVNGKPVQKRWWHGTTQENWKKIQKSRVLWGIDEYGKRCTYLARSREDIEGRELLSNRPFTRANIYFEVMLKVDYEPNGKDERAAGTINAGPTHTSRSAGCMS